MVHDMTYNTVANVLTTWEKVRQIPEYENVVGVQLFQKFFVAEPGAKLVFGFPKDLDLASEEALEDPIFIKNAKWFSHVFTQMIERSLDMLGPDTEVLTEVLLELGQRHVRYGVETTYLLSIDGQSLDCRSGERLGQKNLYRRGSKRLGGSLYCILHRYDQGSCLGRIRMLCLISLSYGGI